jgi:hypothetical protein
MQFRTALQINLHPSDARHAVHTLRHQLGVWGAQVDRVLLTVDTKPSASGRYSDLQYQENRRKLFAHLEEIAGRNPKISILEVDYSRGALEAVRRRYFPTTPAYPEKAFDGGPFHAYFYGLMKADAAYVVHMDSDMLFGGASQIWLEEAIGRLQTTSDALFAGPLPGPPTVDGNLPDLHRSLPGVLAIRAPERLVAPYPAYRFQSVSTRIFVLDCLRFESAANPFELVRPGFKRRLRARLFRQSPLSMPAEEILTLNMMRNGLHRVDFLGSGEGMYSLHPPFRSEGFYRELPTLINRIESGLIPDAQRGHYDINASMMDWTEALRLKTPARRAIRAARALLPI